MKRTIQGATIVISIFVITFSIGYGIGNLAMDARDNTRGLINVKAICDKAHDEISRQSEIDCGRAQDLTNTNYKCNGYGVNATCWVEKR